MGTRGYLVYRYRRRYYVFYNHWDSYPVGLGKAIIETIPQDPTEFEAWLEAKRSLLASWEEIKEARILTLIEDDLHERRTVFEKPDGWSWRDHLQSPEKYSLLIDDRLESTPCYFPPPENMNAEWIYTIDLDHEVLTVDQGAHFWLRKLPREAPSLEDVVEMDGSGGKRFRHSLLPDDMIASLVTRPDRSAEGLSESPARDVLDVRAKALDGFPERVRGLAQLLAAMWGSVRASFGKLMDLILLSLKPEDFVFRECAFAIVSLAKGLSGTLNFVDTRRVAWNSTPGWAAIFPEDSDGTIVASGLAAGYHKQGAQPGSAPLETTYWYEGVVVHLAMGLDNKAIVTNEIRKATAFGQHELTSKGRLDMLLLSIEHVVIARVDGQSVRRTKAMCLLDLPEHWPMSPFIKERTETENAPPAETGFSAFFALIHLFEGSTLRSLKSEAPKEGAFPTEIYESILEHADRETHRACALVSRKFRSICRSRLWLNDRIYVKATAQASKNVEAPGSCNEGSGDRPTGSYTVVESSTGAHSVHRLVVGSRDCTERSIHEYAWLVVFGAAGTSPGRLSTLVLCSFEGLQIDPPPIGLAVDATPPPPTPAKEETLRTAPPSFFEKEVILNLVGKDERTWSRLPVYLLELVDPDAAARNRLWEPEEDEFSLGAAVTVFERCFMREPTCFRSLVEFPVLNRAPFSAPLFRGVRRGIADPQCVLLMWFRHFDPRYDEAANFDRARQDAEREVRRPVTASPHPPFPTSPSSRPNPSCRFYLSRSPDLPKDPRLILLPQPSPHCSRDLREHANSTLSSPQLAYHLPQLVPNPIFALICVRWRATFLQGTPAPGARTCRLAPLAPRPSERPQPQPQPQPQPEPQPQQPPEQPAAHESKWLLIFDLFGAEGAELVRMVYETARSSCALLDQRLRAKFDEEKEAKIDKDKEAGAGGGEGGEGDGRAGAHAEVGNDGEEKAGEKNGDSGGAGT